MRWIHERKWKIKIFLASLSRDLLNQKFHARCNPKKARTFSNCTKKKCLLHDSCRLYYLITQKILSVWSDSMQSKPNFPCTLQDVPTAIHLQQQVVVWCDPIGSLINFCRECYLSEFLYIGIKWHHLFKQVDVVIFSKLTNHQLDKVDLTQHSIKRITKGKAQIILNLVSY